MQNFAIGGKWQSSGPLDCLANFFTSDFAGTLAETNAAMTVHAANVRAGDSDHRVFDGNPGDIFGRLDGLLNARDGSIEFSDDALAHAARIRYAVATVTKGVLVHFGHNDAGLGAADVNYTKQVFSLTTHRVLVLLCLLCWFLVRRYPLSSGGVVGGLVRFRYRWVRILGGR